MPYANSNTGPDAFNPMRALCHALPIMGAHPLLVEETDWRSLVYLPNLYPLALLPRDSSKVAVTTLRWISSRPRAQRRQILARSSTNRLPEKIMDAVYRD